MKNENPFNITREEILNLAATKLADQYADDSDLGDIARKEINARIEKLVKEKLNACVDSALSEEMERILSKEIIPVDIFGDKVGDPTTIRAAIAVRARDYWMEKVDEKGKPDPRGWGTHPRHEFLFKRIAGEEFDKVVKQNMVDLVGAFKDAMRADAQKRCDEYLNELIKVKSLGDNR